MKYLIFTAALLSSLLLFSCKKDKEDKPYYTKAQKDNKAWTGVEFNVYSEANSDVLTLIARAIPEGQTLPEESLIIKFIPTGTGTYKLVEDGSKFYKTLGLDAIISEYSLTSTNANNITVSNYNKKDNTITGTFNLTMHGVYPNTATTNAITFTDGAFYVKVTPIKSRML